MTAAYLWPMSVLRPCALNAIRLTVIPGFRVSAPNTTKYLQKPAYLLY